MEGCYYCEKSKPAWKSLCKKVKSHHKLTEGHVLCEVDSADVQSVGLPKAKVPTAFPTYLMIKDGIINELKQDIETFLKLMLDNGMIVPRRLTRNK